MIVQNIVFIKNILILALSFFLIILSFSLLKSLIFKNKKVRTLQFVSTSEEKKSSYQQRLYELIKIKTSSYNDSEGYHEFREKLKDLFPNIHKYFKKEKIDGHAIFSYKCLKMNVPNVLFATHIDYSDQDQHAYIIGDEVYGNGTFDAKSLLFVMFEAVESILVEQQGLDVNLTMVMATDDETTKEGASKIVDRLMRKGEFFDLVIEEGTGIVDPQYIGLKSHYALIGLGVTGQVTLRFSTEKTNNGQQQLQKFISDMKKHKFLKSKVDRKSAIVVKSLAKDMTFKHRYFLSNLSLFRKATTKIIDRNYAQLAKLLKTNFTCTEIDENDDKVFVDITYELATHDNTADIILEIANLMEKYNIDYNILSNKEESQLTKMYTEGYQVVCNVINKVYHELYIAPIIIANISEKRYFDSVSDCVIRFSPLYYSNQAFIDAKKGNSHVSAGSLEYGVNFFREILKTYQKKEKPYQSHRY